MTGAADASGDGAFVRHRPTRASGLAAVLCSGVAIWFVAADVGGSRLPLLGAAVVLLVAGDGFRARDHRLAAALCLFAGGLAAASAVALAAGGTEDPGAVARLVPGLAGVAIVAAGVVPLRGNGSRGLLRIGTGLVFLSVLAASVLRAVPVGTVLAGAAATVVAWDLGEHAIGLGEQIGRDGGTRNAELTHGVASVAVGGLAVGAGHVAAGFDGVELPLGSLVLVLAGAVLLALALHR